MASSCWDEVPLAERKTRAQMSPPITGLVVGEKVKIDYLDKYTLDVEVTAICPSNEFVGRIEAIFEKGLAQMITGGELHRGLIGQRMTFKNEDIVLRRSDLP
jgi:hypothetical protein